MVTGLKCSPQKADENVEDNRYGWANTRQRHTSDELLDILRKTDRDSGDERFCLAMLLLTKSIFLNMYKGNKFPAAHLKRAQDVHQFLNYPWGIDAFKVMLSSIKSNVPCKLLKGKYDIHGYLLALHLWILESIPVLQSSLSREADENVEENRYGWANTSQRHTSEELLDILRETNRDSGDERFLLAMLLLTECIFLNMFKGNRFPTAHLKRAQDVHQFLNYPWGIDAFKVLLSSIKFNVPSNLLKDKYDIHGYLLALHLWILESIPMLQSSLSRVSLLEPRTAFICERYTSTTTPQISQKENLEASDHLNVICVLPAIPDDPEDTVSLEDEDDPELSLLVDLLSKGYKMKAEDWRRGSLDVGAMMEELDKLYKLVEDEFKSTNQRLSKMEKKLRILSARKRKDQRENHLFFNNPPSPKATEQPAEKADEQAPDQTIEQHIMNKDETNAENQTQEVTQDINSSEKKNEDNVGNRMNQMDGANEQQDNDQHDEDPSLQRDTEDGGVNAENREDSRPTLAQDYSGGLKLMEEVEVFYKNEWNKGEVRAIMTDSIHVRIDELDQDYVFTLENVRYSWRWEQEQILKDKEKGEQILKEKEKGEQSLKEKEKGEQSPKEKEKGEKKLKRIKTPSFDLKIVTPPEEKADEKGNKRQADNTLADNHLKRMKKRKLESRGNDQQIPRRSNRVATPSQHLITTAYKE
ncbi:hypothetical protein ISN45_Aa08g005050 [Arabidopsis thaliana x Arabidopsis arenosa]|uniref:DUF1985 domain-containing protein n=1 Tax=Arabidopsis thaliana x Arabidopsis arenosa TaxID=1240361 RepID=A0A8T1XJT6_9BRAS|nr:hypothetical protein ISN45_Aa08g005050 [Arabidopsis thaliana x Arabidopsis arenosa]